MTKKEKLTKGMVIEIDRIERARLKEIQSKYCLVGADKTLAQIASDCLKIGISSKLTNLSEL